MMNEETGLPRPGFRDRMRNTEFRGDMSVVSVCRAEASPSPEEPLEAGQELVLLGKSDPLTRFKEKMR